MDYHNYILQANAPPKSGDYINNFTDFGPLIVVLGTSESTTNFLDVGGATNKPARHYRVLLVP